MDKDTAITVRLPRGLGEKLRVLAHGLNRTTSDLAVEAIASDVDFSLRQVQEIERGLEEAGSDRLGVPHQEVEKWVRSWDTDNELPRPKPTV
jgi:predicted transcriptional regulator